jgi:hypothetical protein
MFRVTYHEILRTKVDELDELMAQQAQSAALQMGEAMDDALRVTLAGLATSNGVEASQILRNISQARSAEIDKAAQLRGRDFGSQMVKSLADVARELQALGAVRVRDTLEDGRVIDAEAESEDALELIAEVIGEDGAKDVAKYMGD